METIYENEKRENKGELTSLYKNENTETSCNVKRNIYKNEEEDVEAECSSEENQVENVYVTPEHKVTAALSHHGRMNRVGKTVIAIKRMEKSVGRIERVTEKNSGDENVYDLPDLSDSALEDSESSKRKPRKKESKRNWRFRKRYALGCCVLLCIVLGATLTVVLQQITGNIPVMELDSSNTNQGVIHTRMGFGVTQFGKVTSAYENEIRKTDNTQCTKVIQDRIYVTIQDAIRGCKNSRICTGIYDKKCNAKVFKLCHKASEMKSSRQNSCIYHVKDSVLGSGTSSTTSRYPVTRVITSVNLQKHSLVPARPQWEEWSSWQNGKCSTTCGTGFISQRRTRKCNHGVNNCVGHSDESFQTQCNLSICPDECRFQTGYAHGGTDKIMDIRTESAESCFRLVRDYEPRANGLTWETTSQNCYAEFDATRIGAGCNQCRACLF